MSVVSGFQSDTSVTEYRVQVTLYDVAYKQFFGRTWVGPTMAVKPQTQPFKLPYDQVGMSPIP